MNSYIHSSLNWLNLYPINIQIKKAVICSGCPHCKFLITGLRKFQFTNNGSQFPRLKWKVREKKGSTDKLLLSWLLHISMLVDSSFGSKKSIEIDWYAYFVIDRMLWKWGTL